MNSRAIGHVAACQICGHKNLEIVLVFGHQPVVQAYLTERDLHGPETAYPLNLCRCPKCGLLQLDYIVDPRIVFPKNYPYRTGLTNMLIRNFRSLRDALETTYALAPKDLIVDIGSNDGTLLQGFKEHGMRVVGIEPTDAAKVANQNGIPTFQTYFDAAAARRVVNMHGKARIVTATNVFAHVNDVPTLMRNILVILADDGVFVSESQYLLDIVRKLEFDTVYHEHLRFYAVKPLSRLFALHGATLVDAERISAAGGSIRAYAMKGKRRVSARVRKLISEETRAGLYDSKKLAAFAEQVIRAKNDLLALLLRVKKEGARIAGIGSPARANTLLGFSHINTHLVDYASEKNGSPKIGLFTPGTHIPVADEKRLFREQPEYALILSWHIGEELMEKLRELGYRGKFIMPLPVPRIVRNI